MIGAIFGYLYLIVWFCFFCVLTYKFREEGYDFPESTLFGAIVGCFWWIIIFYHFTDPHRNSA